MSVPPTKTSSTPYQDVILSHAKSPQHYGKLQEALLRSGVNPLCGDEIDLYLTRSDEVFGLAFESRGCALCRASASILAASVAGLTRVEARQVVDDFKHAFRAEGALSSASLGAVSSDLDALIAMRTFATRTRCVLLSWDTFTALLEELP